MNRLQEIRLDTLVVSLLAGLTTWLTLLAWSGFAQQPSGYLVPLFGACLLVALLGAVLRAVRVPVPLVALAQIALVLLWLQHRIAGGDALAGWFPTPTSIQATVDAVSRASEVAREYAAPVPVSVPEFYPLMILAGASTAVLVDLLAVGLRRVPLAGLPLLAVYTTPINILQGGVAWPVFAAAALCFLFLVAAVEGSRLTHWGHRLTPGRRVFDLEAGATGSGGVWPSARRIGVTATALALVVPLLLPTFSGSLFGGGSGDGDGSGDAVSISNPMVDLRRDLTRGADVDLVSVSTDDPDPSYLRVTVLDSFDGSAWRPADRDIPVEQRAEGAVPRPLGLVAGVPTRSYDSSITVSEFFRSRWLPTPFPQTSVTVPGDWRYDRSTMDFINAADGETAGGLTYQVRSLDVRPTAATLANAPLAPLPVAEPNTALPKDFPGSVRALARKVTADQPSLFEKAVALQQWFRVDGGFRYSLQRSSGNGTDDLVGFLSTGENGRVGYCEQFAAAMAVMGRSLGIPSRVAVGFLRPDDRGDRFVYSSHDLHAWPEMYFGGVGWIRFEPTPQARTGGVPAYTTQQVPRAAPSVTASSATTSAAGNGAANKPLDAQTAVDATGGSSSSGGLLWLGALAVVLLAALLAAPRALRSSVRRRRRHAAGDPATWVEAGWQEVRDTARDLGIGWDDHATLRTTAASVEQHFGDPDGPDASSPRPPRGPELNPGAVAALQRLLQLLERARYARSLPPDATTQESVVADVDRCVGALRAGAGRRRVTRARWLPASLVATLSLGRRRSSLGPRRLTDAGVDRAV